MNLLRVNWLTYIRNMRGNLFAALFILSDQCCLFNGVGVAMKSKKKYSSILILYNNSFIYEAICSNNSASKNRHNPKFILMQSKNHPSVNFLE